MKCEISLYTDMYVVWPQPFCLHEASMDPKLSLEQKLMTLIPLLLQSCIYTVPRVSKPSDSQERSNRCIILLFWEILASICTGWYKYRMTDKSAKVSPVILYSISSSNIYQHFSKLIENICFNPQLIVFSNFIILDQFLQKVLRICLTDICFVWHVSQRDFAQTVG